MINLYTLPLDGRYALEEGRYGYDQEPPPWNKWELLHIVRYLLQHGAKNSINQPGNSALASVLRHVKDWEFRWVGGENRVGGGGGFRLFNPLNSALLLYS